MKRKGFTLVELVIVIVIVGILSIVAVPIYRGYTRKAMATEGKALPVHLKRHWMLMQEQTNTLHLIQLVQAVKVMLLHLQLQYQVYKVLRLQVLQ